MFNKKIWVGRNTTTSTTMLILQHLLLPLSIKDEIPRNYIHKKQKIVIVRKERLIDYIGFCTYEYQGTNLKSIYEIQKHKQHLVWLVFVVGVKWSSFLKKKKLNNKKWYIITNLGNLPSTRCTQGAPNNYNLSQVL